MEDSNRRKTEPKLNKIEIYKLRMRNMDLMKEHLNDATEIFDINSLKCKNFLINCFTILNPNFHYLSFLNNESIDNALLRAACILQIYPFNRKQDTNEIFHNMNDMDIHNFWMRLFKQCELHNTGLDKDLFNNQILNNQNNSILFHDMNFTLHHFTYDISILNPKTPKEKNLTEEIDSWFNSTLTMKFKDCNDTLNKIDGVTEKKNNYFIDINKLFSDVNYIKKNIDLKDLTFYTPTNLFKNFFIDFTYVVKEIISLREDLKLINSLSLENLINNTTSYTSCYWLLHNNKIKLCNNYIQKIKFNKDLLGKKKFDVIRNSDTD